MGVKSSGREYEIKSGDDVGIKDWGDMKVKFRWKKICSFDFLKSGSLQNNYFKVCCRTLDLVPGWVVQHMWELCRTGDQFETELGNTLAVPPGPLKWTQISQLVSTSGDWVMTSRGTFLSYR